MYVVPRPSFSPVHMDSAFLRAWFSPNLHTRYDASRAQGPHQAGSWAVPPPPTAQETQLAILLTGTCKQMMRTLFCPCYVMRSMPLRRMIE